MRRAAIAAALVACLCLAAPSAAAAGSPSPSPFSAVSASPPAEPSVVYRLGTTLHPDGFNPFTARSAVSRDCFLLCYDYLTTSAAAPDGGYEVAPDLASDWKVSEGGRVWSFTVRTGMIWHDGVAVTAADIAFTYDWVLRARPPAYIGYLAGVSRVQAPDATTLVITCRAPSVAPLHLAIPVLPEHIWRPYSDMDLTATEGISNVALVGSVDITGAWSQLGGKVVTQVVRLQMVKVGPGADECTA